MNDEEYHAQFWKHDGFLGFLNLFKVPHGSMSMLAQFRPHFPILVNEDNNYEVLRSMNRADFGCFVAFNLVGLWFVNWVSSQRMDVHSGQGKYSAKGFASRIHMQTVENNMLDVRRNFLKVNLLTSSMLGLSMAYINAKKRLRGETYNGQRWARRSLTTNKFDFYRGHKKHWFWKNFIYQH